MVAKKSRRGTKAWRQNISDHEELTALKKANARAEVAALKDEDLFQIDSSRDDKTAEAVIEGQRKRARDSVVGRKYRDLKIQKEKMKKEGLLMHKRKQRRVQPPKDPLRKSNRNPMGKSNPYLTDLWEEQPKESLEWDVPRNTKDLKPGSGHTKKVLRALRRSEKQMSAVIVDHPGCSYNPDYTHHQAALGEAVAAEQEKAIAKVMAPSILDGFDPSQVADDPDIMAVDDGEAENEKEEDDADDEGPTMVGKPTTTDTRKSRAERNRQVRVRIMNQQDSARRRNRLLLKQINNVKQIINEIDGEAALATNLQQRKKAEKVERAKVKPPKLGKHKYKAPGLPVLCSDEVTGSLRKLKPSVMLCRDMTKGFERVGAIEVTPESFIPFPSRKKGVEYISGERTERAVAAVVEGRALQDRVKELEKQVNLEKKKT